MIPSCTERWRDQQPYPAMQNVEATLVARPACSRKSRGLGISRRSWCLEAARFRRGRNRRPDAQEIKKPCRRGGLG
jgi:hypothetical protein